MRRSVAPRRNPRAGVLATAVIALGALACANSQVWSATEKSDAARQDGAPDSLSDKGLGSDSTSCTEPKPPAGSCDPLTNQGCPSDKKCTALRDDKTLSLGCGSKGDKHENDDCQPTLDTGTQTGDDCGDGLACFNWTDEPSPKCHKICARSGCASGCAEGWTCSRGLPGISGYWSCTAACKPLDQSGCQSGQGCYVASNGPGCAEAGSKATGDECDPSKVNDCEAGSTCITGLSNGNRCLAFCSTSGVEPKCSGTCNKMPVEDAVMSQPNVGYCR
jgi:hypothetical protein